MQYSFFFPPQIRLLLTQKTELDKKLSNRDTSLSQLEARLQTAQKDKSSLQAKVATLEKEIANLKTSNEKLKSKVTVCVRNALFSDHAEPLNWSSR